MATAEAGMIRVTWEWLGGELALDLANTVTVSNGVEYDLLAPYGEYERWAARASGSPALAVEEAEALIGARARVLRLRESIRRVLSATAAGEPRPQASVGELNRTCRRSARWLELTRSGELCERSSADAAGRLLAAYARSAIEIAAAAPDSLRRCAAPSCGMFYRPRRKAQRWCSTPCGTRARVARHYRAHH
jgi:predicted RNA-binding Zn ribbon-like protein